MSESCRAESFAVVVNHHRTKDNLITSVPIHIANGEVVVTIAKPRAGAVIGIPTPALRQLVGGWINIQGTHLVLGVATTSQEDAGLASVQIRSTKIVLGRAVTRVVLTPYSRIVAFATLETWEWVCHRGVGCCLVVIVVRNGSLTIHIEQVFSTISGVFITWRHIAHVTHLDDRTIGSVDDHIVCTTHQALSLSVHVPVEADKIPLLIRTSHQGQGQSTKDVCR